MKKLSAFFILLSLNIFHSIQAANICNLEGRTYKTEQGWLDSISWEFDNVINGYANQALELEQIPDLLLDTAIEAKLPRAWKATEKVINAGPRGTLLDGGKHSQAMQRMLAKHFSSEATLLALEGLGAVADIFVLGVWYEDVVRSFWSDSQTALDKISTLFSIVPVLGESLMYYDYLSHLETTQTIVNHIQSQTHYSYSVKTPELNTLSHNQGEVFNHYRQFKHHINTVFKRMADIQILHFDNLYTAKVMEYEKVLDAQVSNFDLEFFKNQMLSYNQGPTDKFGLKHCQNEQQQLISHISQKISASPDQLVRQLRQCNKDAILSTILRLWYLSNLPRNKEARQLLFNAEQQIVDKAMLDLSLWRKKFLDATKQSLQLTLHNLLSSQSVKNYQQAIYKKARSNAIRNFSLKAFQRQPSQKELATGIFYVDRGELVCGIYSCSTYAGREVRFNEIKDPVLEGISQPLVTVDIERYINQRVKQGWTEEELMTPLTTLLEQWQERLNDQARHRPKGGNPALVKIEDAFPQLISVLEGMSNANQMSHKLDQLISRIPMEQAWSNFGDFVFPALYRLRQSNTQNLLPLHWQKKAWHGKTVGVLFNAFLSKPYLYLSSAEWVQALPHFNSRTLHSNWYLFQDQGQTSYLSELPSDEMINSDRYWNTLMAQLASVSESAELRWKPFTRLILVDYLEQLASAEALVQLARSN